MLVDHVMVGTWNEAGPDRRLDPDVDTGDLGADEGAAGNAVIFYHEIYGQQLAVSSSWQLAERTMHVYVFIPRAEEANIKTNTTPWHTPCPVIIGYHSLGGHRRCILRPHLISCIYLVY